MPDLPDAQLSTAHLVAKQDFGSGALDPREYQIELFERAKERNTIAVLDTGISQELSHRFHPKNCFDLMYSYRIWKDLDSRPSAKAYNSE